MIKKSLLLAVLFALTGCQAVHDAIEYNDSDSMDYSTKQKFQPGGGDSSVNIAGGAGF
jgi:starvation-inducible outer membrane lipoprotein